MEDRYMHESRVPVPCVEGMHEGFHTASESGVSSLTSETCGLSDDFSPW